MQFKIDPTKSKLTFFLTNQEKTEIRRLPDEEEQLDEIEIQLRALLANSELSEISPEYTGDLTDAPMFGILGEVTTDEKGPFGSIPVGYTDGSAQYAPIVSKWAYMSYQILNPWKELLLKGEVTLMGGSAEVGERILTAEETTIHDRYIGANPPTWLDMIPDYKEETNKYTVSLHESDNWGGALIEEAEYDLEEDAEAFITFLQEKAAKLVLA